MFFFLQMVVRLLCHAGGASLFTIEKKSYLQFEKIKIEKSYVQLEKIKSKRIEKKAMYRLKNKN